MIVVLLDLLLLLCLLCHFCWVVIVFHEFLVLMKLSQEHMCSEEFFTRSTGSLCPMDVEIMFTLIGVSFDFPFFVFVSVHTFALDHDFPVKTTTV